MRLVLLLLLSAAGYVAALNKNQLGQRRLRLSTAGQNRGAALLATGKGETEKELEDVLEEYGSADKFNDAVQNNEIRMDVKVFVNDAKPDTYRTIETLTKNGKSSAHALLHGRPSAHTHLKRCALQASGKWRPKHYPKGGLRLHCNP